MKTLMLWHETTSAFAAGYRKIHQSRQATSMLDQAERDALKLLECHCHCWALLWYCAKFTGLYQMKQTAVCSESNMISSETGKQYIVVDNKGYYYFFFSKIILFFVQVFYILIGFDICHLNARLLAYPVAISSDFGVDTWITTSCTAGTPRHNTS